MGVTRAVGVAFGEAEVTAKVHALFLLVNLTKRLDSFVHYICV
jgi:hypothetical protein